MADVFLHNEKTPECVETLSDRVARKVRSSHCAFREVNVKEEDGAIVLGGRLPSFYLKQMVQTVACEVDGVEQLDNRVEVIRSRTVMV